MINFGSVNLYTANTGTHQKKGEPNVNTTLPLTLWACKSCSNMQLGEVVNPNFLYKNFQYKSNITLGLSEHFSVLSNSIIETLKIKKTALILDVGSNDGTFLKNFINIANVIGVEPGKKIATEANNNGIFTINEYFDLDLARKFSKEKKFFKVIFCANTIANIDNVENIFEAFKLVLAKDGYLIIETQSGLDLVNNFLIDTIYHEHLSYFTVTALRKFLDKKGLRIDYVKSHKQKGGSIQIWITHKNNESLLSLSDNELKLILKNEKIFRNLEGIKVNFENRIKEVLTKISKIKVPVICYGASVGSNTLLNIFCKKLNIKMIVDDNPAVSELPFDGRTLEVKKMKSLQLIDKELVIVLAYRYFNKIRERNALKPNLKFIKIIE
jgi:SAM-dependent methyltransferase